MAWCLSHHHHVVRPCGCRLSHLTLSSVSLNWIQPHNTTTCQHILHNRPRSQWLSSFELQPLFPSTHWRVEHWPVPGMGFVYEHTAALVIAISSLVLYICLLGASIYQIRVQKRLRDASSGGSFVEFKLVFFTVLATSALFSLPLWVGCLLAGSPSTCEWHGPYYYTCWSFHLFALIGFSFCVGMRRSTDIVMLLGTPFMYTNIFIALTCTYLWQGFRPSCGQTLLTTPKDSTQEQPFRSLDPFAESSVCHSAVVDGMRTTIKTTMHQLHLLWPIVVYAEVSGWTICVSHLFFLCFVIRSMSWWSLHHSFNFIFKIEMSQTLSNTVTYTG